MIRCPRCDSPLASRQRATGGDQIASCGCGFEGIVEFRRVDRLIHPRRARGGPAAGLCMTQQRFPGFFFPELRTDGRTCVTFLLPGRGYVTMPVAHVRPRKRLAVVRDHNLVKLHKVPFDAILEVWDRPWRAKKSRLVWKKPE